MLRSATVALAATTLAGCHVHAQEMGPTIARNYQVGNFQKIEVAGPYDVEVRTGANASVSARGSQKLLERTGVDVGELDLVELNEAFASHSLVVIRELGLDAEKVNVNGGAIALGHPLGMSGARLVVTLLHELRRRGGRYGLATLCVGVGQGQAALFERS